MKPQIAYVMAGLSFMMFLTTIPYYLSSRTQFKFYEEEMKRDEACVAYGKKVGWACAGCICISPIKFSTSTDKL